MATRFVEITRTEINDFFDRHSLHWSENIIGNELAMDHVIAPGIVVRVLTSLAQDQTSCRGKGRDAMRVFAIEGDTGLVKSHKTLRTVNWRKNLADRIDDVVQLAKLRSVDPGAFTTHTDKEPQPSSEAKDPPSFQNKPARRDIHNGTYTVINRSTGEYRTLEIKTVLPDEYYDASHFKNKFSGRRTVSLLVGPDNTSDFKMIGWLNQDGMRPTKKHSANRGTCAMLNLLYSLATLGENSPFAAQYEMRKEGKCLICNRKLTTPDSIALGIGPVCAGKA